MSMAAAGEESLIEAAKQGDDRAFERLISPYRRELRAHCYRMSGSLSDAEDMLQESIIRAWKGLGRFEGRASLRTWLYKVATSACLDGLDRKAARVMPMELGPAVQGDEAIGPPRPDLPWLEPCPEDFYVDVPVSPEARYGARESVALAFLVALQVLPPKQRAILLLHDVLGQQATECAELLETSVAAVNSALQRARATLAEKGEALRSEPPPPGDESTTSLLARYVEAWELADVSKLVSLLREDAVLSMPPMSAWMRGAAAIGTAIEAMVFCRDGAPIGRGRFRFVATRANGSPAFGVYQLDNGTWRPAAIHVLGVEAGRIATLTAFINPSLFAAFGLPLSING